MCDPPRGVVDFQVSRFDDAAAMITKTIAPTGTVMMVRNAQPMSPLTNEVSVEDPRQLL